MIYVRKLRWNGWNVAHIARHEVEPSEVEEVCHGLYIARASYKERLMLIGSTKAARMIAVVLESEGDGIYYPITARVASRKERRLYLEEKGGEEAA